MSRRRARPTVPGVTHPTRPLAQVPIDGAVGARRRPSLVLGVALRLAGSGDASDATLAVSSLAILLPLAWSVARSLRRHDVGVDGIALVAIVGALLLSEYLAAAVIAVMLAGGNALEASAQRRARRELTALAARMPRTARRRAGSASRRCRSTRSRPVT